MYTQDPDSEHCLDQPEDVTQMLPRNILDSGLESEWTGMGDSGPMELADGNIWMEKEKRGKVENATKYHLVHSKR